MPHVTHNKLVRDLIPSIVEKNGELAKTRKLRLSEYKQALKTKLCEEAAEAAASTSKSDLIEELADMQEVLLALYDAYGIDCKDVTKTARAKRKKKGGFASKLFLEYTE